MLAVAQVPTATPVPRIEEDGRFDSHCLLFHVNPEGSRRIWHKPDKQPTPMQARKRNRTTSRLFQREMRLTQVRHFCRG